MDSDSTEDHSQPIEVYLRMKPTLNTHEKPCFTRQSDHEMITHPPGHSFGRSESYSFSYIFDVDATQNEIFDKVVLDPLENFVNGTSALLFSFGATGAGKSYTLKGMNQAIGIIPRAVDVLFNSVTVDTSLDFVPCDYTVYKRSTDAVKSAILKNKADLLKQALKSDKLAFNSAGSTRESDGLTLDPCIPREQEHNITVSVKRRVGETVSIALFVSFVEIYNETIFDLLLLSPSAASIPSRPFLEIRTNKNGNSFLKGVTYVPVFSAEEAFALLRLGMCNQQVASTRLNHNSSRSHSIFSILAIRTIVPLLSEGGGDDMGVKPHYAQVSEFHFCDLAGSERMEKAGTSGIRLYEAKKINNSLTTLKRCIDLLRVIQINPESNAVVPYRDSKLTRLLQMFFSGHGRVYIMANISLDSNMFPESIGTLKFAAIAQTVLSEAKEGKIDPIHESCPTPPVAVMAPSSPLVRRTQFLPPNRGTTSISEAAFGGARQNKLIMDLQEKNSQLEKEVQFMNEVLKVMETEHMEEIRRLTEEFRISSNRRIRIFTDAAIKDTADEYEKKMECLQTRIDELMGEMADQRDIIDHLQRRNENNHVKQRQLKHRCSILSNEVQVDEEAMKIEDLKVSMEAKLSQALAQHQVAMLEQKDQLDSQMAELRCQNAALEHANALLKQQLADKTAENNTLLTEKQIMETMTAQKHSANSASDTDRVKQRSGHRLMSRNDLVPDLLDPAGDQIEPPLTDDDDDFLTSYTNNKRKKRVGRKTTRQNTTTAADCGNNEFDNENEPITTKLRSRLRSKK